LFERAVRDDLVSRPDPEEVALDEFLHPRQPPCARADDSRVWCDESRQPVERALRSYLLHRPDPGVADQDAEEERVLPFAERQGEPAGDCQDQVEDREDVCADNACVGAARARARERPTLGEAACRLGLREPLRCLRVVRERACHKPAGPMQRTLAASDGRRIVETPDQLRASPQHGRSQRGGRSASPRNP
jgi:hypothetical protein